MTELRYILLADGPTYAALLPILTFLLRENSVRLPIQPAWADLRQLTNPPKGLANRIISTLRLNDGDLLFIHRDAEREATSVRENEIEIALAEAKEISLTEAKKNKVEKPIVIPPMVRVVPVRMTETWLFSSEAAIRRAAGNPNGPMLLNLPALQNVEHLPDPKETLYTLLKTASGLKGRRLQNFSTRGLSKRVADLTEDEAFALMRGVVPTFDALESEIKAVVQAQNWHSAP